MPRLTIRHYGGLMAIYFFLLVFFSSIVNADEGFLEATQAFVPMPQVEKTATEKTLQIDWHIASQYYLYRHMFNAYQVKGGTRSPLVFTLPKGERHFDPFLEKDVETYSDTVIQSIPMADVSGAFQLTLEAQGCSKKGLCYSPQQYYFHVDSDGTVSPLDKLSNISNDLPISEPNPNSKQLSLTSLFLYLVSAFAGGLILNLMPCVFPVLSLKALSFASLHQNESEQKSHGWIYSVGVMLSFVAIAAIILLARATGESLGWGFQLQHPAFVIFMLYLFFIMGLNLMGFIEIGGAYAGLGQQLTTGHSRTATFFTGVLAVLVASPCTAPFMAPALGVALTQPVLYSLSIFIALAFGMASPFLLLSYFPQLSRYLPRPGNWMVVFKQFLAFPIFSTAIWLFWVLARQTDVNTSVTVLLGLVCLTFSLWLWRFSHSQNRHHRLIKIVSMTALAPAIFFALNTQSKQAEPALNTKPNVFSYSRLEQLRQAGHPVFVDVTADWCITCKVNESVALTAEVKRKLKQNDVEILVADWTNTNTQVDRLLKEFDRSGVPLYLFYPVDGGKAEMLPQILTQQTVIAAMSRAITRGARSKEQRK